MPPPPPPPPPKPPVRPAAIKQALEDLKPIRLVPGSKMNPVLIYEVKPKYPPEVQADKLEGTVTVDAIVDTTGAVYEAMVVQSIPAFDQAALDAVKQWRFQPALLNGEPVAVVCTIEFTFTVK